VRAFCGRSGRKIGARRGIAPFLGLQFAEERESRATRERVSDFCEYAPRAEASSQMHDIVEQWRRQRRRENAGGKERSLGFKAAINPLRPFLKPSARASGGQPWLLPDCIPRYFAPPFRLPRPRIHPRPFRPIATISADVGGILTNSIASAVSEPREAADFSAYRVCV